MVGIDYSFQAALNSVGLQDRNKYGSTYTTEEKPVRKAVDYYVNPNVPTIEELRQQAQAEKDQTAAVKGREEWAVNKEIAKVGEWEIVEAPAPSITQPSTQKEYKKDEATTHDQKPEFQDDDEDQEDLHSFKIREKEFPADLDIGNEDPADEDTAVTFKKRKLGDTASFKSRKKKPLRKKDQLQIGSIFYARCP